MECGKSIVLGIAGGTGSGKTTLAHAVQKRLGEASALLITQDSYYKDRSHIADEKRLQVNYDHPEALELSLLATHLMALRAGQDVEIPMYDFSTHTRSACGILTSPKPIIIVEGILIFSDSAVRDCCDLKVFVETPDDVRFIRRLVRDMAERSRTAISVVDQYLATVRPMHREFVAAGSGYADLVVDGEQDLQQGVDDVIQLLEPVSPHFVCGICSEGRGEKQRV